MNVLSSGLPDWQRTKPAAGTSAPYAPCAERMRRMRAWVDSVQRFSELASQLAAESGKSKLEYNRFFNKVELARAASDNLRLLLDAHRSEHGC